MGTVITKLAKPIINKASIQFNPAFSMYEASNQVGMHTAMPTHKAARCQWFQVRAEAGTGASSSLYSEELRKVSGFSGGVSIPSMAVFVGNAYGLANNV